MSGTTPCAGLSLSAPQTLLESACFKYALSKALGYGIVLGSAGVKLPQVLNIVRAKSTVGLSPSSIIIEMASLVSSFAYFMALGYPFSTWGENFFLFFQHAAITACYFHYTSGIMSGQSIGTFIPLAAMGVALYKRAVPDLTLPAAVSELLGLPGTITCEQLAGGLPVLLMLFGRLPQIVQNFKQGHTGQLSLITYCLNVAGSGARAFTVVQELNDPLVLTSALSSFVQNALLVAQILLLGSPKSNVGSGAGAKGKKAKKAD